MLLFSLCKIVLLQIYLNFVKNILRVDNSEKISFEISALLFLCGYCNRIEPNPRGVSRSFKLLLIIVKDNADNSLERNAKQVKSFFGEKRFGVSTFADYQPI